MILVNSLRGRFGGHHRLPALQIVRVTDRRGQRAAVKRLYAFRRDQRHIQAMCNIGGDMFAADRHNGGKKRLAFVKNADTGCAAAHIHMQHTQIQLILHERRQGAGIGRDDQFFALQMALVNAAE